MTAPTLEVLGESFRYDLICAESCLSGLGIVMKES